MTTKTKLDSKTKTMNEQLVEQWKKGWNDGEDSVLEFLKDMKGIDIREEYESWANADEYTKLNGEVIKRYQ